MKNTPADDTNYRVVDWDTNAIIATFDTLGKAKKHCKSLGYVYTRLSGNIPLAYVQCDIIIDGVRYTDCCIYNPRFN
jgi:hypothetical protein